MFDLGWSEMLVVGVVALIVVGPKELPGMFRTVGRFTGKAKAMAREFTRAMEDAANESGVKDVAADLNKLNRTSSPRKMGTDAFKKATADLNPFNEDGKAPNPGDLDDDPAFIEGDDAERSAALADQQAASAGQMTDERAEQARLIREKSAEKAQARLDRDAAAAQAELHATAEPGADEPAPAADLAPAHDDDGQTRT